MDESRLQGSISIILYGLSTVLVYTVPCPSVIVYTVPCPSVIVYTVSHTSASVVGYTVWHMPAMHCMSVMGYTV